MSSHPSPTVYCALCAIPCLTPPRSPLRSSFLDTTPPSEEWLSDLSALRLVSTPTPPPNSTSPPTQTIHQITLHSYCLSSAVRLATPLPKVPNHGASSDGENGSIKRKVQIWNLPKFSGLFNWGEKPVEDGRVRGEDDEMVGHLGRVEGKDMRGIDKKSWIGLEAQMERWKLGERHYLDKDLMSPITLPPPSSDPPTNIIRPIQSNRLTSLPPHLFLQITSYLLDPPQLASSSTLPTPAQTTPPQPNFFALLHTSTIFRDFAFPHAFWANLVRGEIHQYTQDLLTQWKTSPIKNISIERLQSVLKSEFGAPVEAALGVALSKNSGDSALLGDSGGAEECEGYTARDVFDWWMYSEPWRSRRRIWRSIVHGCARARDSDAEQ